MEKQRLSGLIVVLIVISILGIGKAEMLTSQANVSYDSKILDEFENYTWVNIFLKLDNYSQADSFLSTFSENEFRKYIKTDISSRISGEINSAGFYKLINDSGVRVVYFDESIYGDDNNYAAEVEQDVIDALQSSVWVPVIIRVTSINEALVDSVLDTLSSSDFQLKEKLLKGDGFWGNVSQEGFNKLANNPNVRTIYLDRIAHVLDDKIGPENINKTCREDSDCVTISLTCCGCQVASFNTPIEELLTSINIDYINQWNEDIEKKCLDAICPQGVSLEQTKRCDSYKPKCINNECVISTIFGEKPEKGNNLWLIVIPILVVSLILTMYIVFNKKKQ